MDALGGVNNLADARQIVDRAITAADASDSPVASALAASELLPLLKNFKHKTADDAASNSARPLGWN